MAVESDTPMGGQHPDVDSHSEERSAKRIKIDDTASAQEQSGENGQDAPHHAQNGNHVEPSDNQTQPISEASRPSEESGEPTDRVKGLAPIKKEYLIDMSGTQDERSGGVDDDAAEGRRSDNRDRSRGDGEDSRSQGKKGKKKAKGQNTDRTFGRFDDAIPLCNSRAYAPEFSPKECQYGERCKMCHDLRKYLSEGRREDVEALGGKCPAFEAYGYCASGWKCRFVKSHMEEIEHADGKKELVLSDNRPPKPEPKEKPEAGEAAAPESSEENGATVNGREKGEDELRPGIYNVVTMGQKIQLNRKRLDLSKADQYITWLNHEAGLSQDFHHRRKDQPVMELEDLRARFTDPPFKPSEKRRLYFGAETPTLAPLTTQGNLPFRRLCVELGCQATYSEMALGMPLLQGSKPDWTLMRAHKSEITPPKMNPGAVPLFDDYNHSRDLKFGAQISGSAHWVVTKAADVLNRFCPHLRLIDLNCGCPIDKVFKSGAGSALLDASGKMERMIRGMNAVSGEIPITAKIRTGVRKDRPTAPQVISKLAFGAREHRERFGAPGCAALTLHGRSREQRYTKTADWGYIGECAALIKSYNDEKAQITDTMAEPDESTLANAKDGRMYFLGNGDCYSHVDYYEHIEKARVDTVMIGRGALIKPWIFEEIEKGQYLDKSSTERLGYIEKFVRYGLEAWGSDELGIGFTRRFLLEYLSFAHRYVPIGLLEHLPPRLNDRPPAYKGRNEMETLMASDNYKDWIKISEMFLGPVHPGFQFQPKHKSNSYEAEG
ncbi:trna-dihydrouridine synthase 3 [Trichoderma arundinaceum]|uniref:tRNA-dihydrouridine(47) synthase [NAD(P)(+)] n=1 Tax=Trichoderma arundinaceum TaxID=490622 RepID=A0A395NKZ3_TRIAR|nr:trna-dihydrouridine synthase 3 [Trichoderma arundinaceum]